MRCNPDVLFLSETHLDSYPAECLRRRLKMDFKIVNPSDGRSGGVLLLWKKEISIQQIFSAPKYIDVRIIENPNKIWRFTGFYGEPKWEDKHLSWDKIRELNSQHDMPWAIMGDFNEILFSDEKEGGNPRPLNYMQAFQDALSDCGLEDMSFSGDIFTWKRGRIRERLDRAVANGDWLTMHQGARLQHLEYARSDHRPLLLDTDFVPVIMQSNRSKKFEAKWLKDKQFSQVVERSWAEASLAVQEGGVLAKLAHLHGMLHAWDTSINKEPRRKLREAQRDLDKTMSGPIDEENETKAKELATVIELLLEQDEIHWLQRSKANWLHQGDRNTSFFIILLLLDAKRIILSA
jgi:hypothetical protein